MKNQKQFKKVMIELEDGRLFSVNAQVVAKSRAEYYAQIDVKDDPSLKFEEVYDKEFAYSISSEDELVDWLENNMNWYDLDPIEEQNGTMPSLSDVDVEDMFAE